LNATALARAILGIGHVVVLPAHFTWTLTEQLGKARSVFGGAVRAYLSGFTLDANPYAHRLVLAEQLATADGAAQCDRWLRWLAASESLRRVTLGRDVLFFGTIRNASLTSRQQRLVREGASDTEQLAAANARIRAFEEQNKQDQDLLTFYEDEHRKAEERAEVAEEQARASAFRIQQLLGRLADVGSSDVVSCELPTSWSDFANWCDVQLAGRVVLSPTARRSVRDPEFEDCQQAARCLLWPSTECHEHKTRGGGTLRDEVVEPGVRNSLCGEDQFDLDWQGQRYTADWHIKSGGNTRDPRRCLRIYYFWHDATQQIVIADMPAHRRTSAT
jgi:hypothetical protein